MNENQMKWYQEMFGLTNAVLKEKSMDIRGMDYCDELCAWWKVHMPEVNPQACSQKEIDQARRGIAENKLWERMSREVQTQDNASTSYPIFVVQQRNRIYGIDPDLSDDATIVWLDAVNDCQEIHGEERDKLEEEYQKTFTVPGDNHRTGYVDYYEFVQPFFTKAGAEEYIEANRHRLKEPRIYVDSAYRNPEWQAVLRHLRSLTTL